MDIMEKLVGLIDAADEECKHSKDCKSCSGYRKGSLCRNYCIADHLIANGVTFKDVPDTNVGEWISVDKRLPEKDGRYLVAMKDGDNYHISTRKFKRTDPPVWWKGSSWGHWAKRTCGVRYWDLLPEPPKGE